MNKTMNVSPVMLTWPGGGDPSAWASTQAALECIAESANTIVVMNNMPLVRADHIAKWIGKLKSLSKLAPGWNRQGAPAPSENAIRGARQLIEAMVNDEQPPTRVAASAVGGVGVTRRVGERMAYVEFYNDGGACALLTDDGADGADERVLDVGAGGGTFRDLLDQVKAYFNG